MKSSDERLATLESIEAIRRLKYRYAQYSDERRPREMADLFTEDGIWDGGERFGYAAGREAIYAFILEAWHELQWAAHFVTNGDIAIDSSGSEASGRWRLWEAATLSGNPVWIMGHYEDKYRLAGGDWLFTESRLDSTSLPHTRPGGNARGLSICEPISLCGPIELRLQRNHGEERSGNT